MKTIYEDGSYLKNNPTWHEEESQWKAKQITRMLAKHNIIPSTVCDVGCGAGGIIECLANDLTDGIVFYGYDISPQAFEISRKKEKRNLHFFLEDLLENEGLTFDVVMALDVFEHVEDYIMFLRRLKNKGTYKILHIPLDLSVQTVLLGTPILKTRSSFGHLHYFTKETALATLKDAGYEVLDHFYTGISVEIPSRNWMANLMKLPRRFFFSLHHDLTVRILGGYSLLVLAK